MIGVISDIHANLEALEAVLADMDEKKVDDLVCLGDLVGFGVSPNECCDIIKGLDVNCVMGNHDYAVSTGKLWNWFDNPTQESLKWTSEELSRNHKLFLSVLPRKLVVEFGDVRLGLVHGSPWDELFEYVQPTVSDSVLKKFLDEMDCDVLALGHTHIPFAKEVKTGLVFNPGSVGQPRDGIPMASYAIFDPDEFKVKVVRVEYDVDKAVSKMKRAEIPRFFWERLSEGI